MTLFVVVSSATLILKVSIAVLRSDSIRVFSSLCIFSNARNKSATSSWPAISILLSSCPAATESATATAFASGRVMLRAKT